MVAAAHENQPGSRPLPSAGGGLPFGRVRSARDRADLTGLSTRLSVSHPSIRGKSIANPAPAMSQMSEKLIALVAW